MKKIILVLITTMLLGYFIGFFSKGFELNLCYSNILSKIQNDIDNAVETQNKDDLIKIKNKLKLLPLRGYESDCKEIGKMYAPARGI